MAYICVQHGLIISPPSPGCKNAHQTLSRNAYALEASCSGLKQQLEERDYELSELKCKEETLAEGKKSLPSV